ncbi:hypothetical protein LR48_Vigan06g020800 [Vigna angularis]|uniref:AT-hook motif nuclear-localized protein n=2 Tax=Phaseolus angularis TaxID=3914 RepID=A0A0L9UQM7_PHAAN|nr:AT-hook motif nuclear-localized protein 8 [Vigna angularis]KAG2375866.1 AT-hook motif nuclear-localized protein [Vigna angularis]KOM44902.1 hypothetical protein LR48_Vigan06g020800 [Vigna angularis]BAU00349.1 hypothetical protein VIGAN_10193500 [Vigna angularis var. angularis]
MDSREPHQQPQLPNMMMGPTSYPSMLAPATARFPFISNNHHHHHNPPPPPPPPEPLNDNHSCEAALKPCALGVGSSESSKKKRGRPRKYSPDGNIALGLVPNYPAASSAESPAKKHRGRPPGSGKKQMDALGISGTGFTPHVISAEAGEDIGAKIMAFCEQGPRAVCILSAVGPIRNVTIRQPPSVSSLSGPDVSYEGEFEIISLTGFTQQSENNNGHIGMRSLSISLAGPDGRVLGGEVTGALTAASAVQVVVGSFIADGKKSSSNNLKSGRSTTPSSQLLTFGAPTTPTTPTSQGPSTESSEDNENSNFIKGPGGPGLSNNASQPIHNLQMYHHQLWAGHTQQ